MSKVNLKAKLIYDDENLEVNTKCLKLKNKIIYKENDIIVTITINSNIIELERLCHEYKINLIFDATKSTISTYELFGAPKIFELKTTTKKLVFDENNLIIEYELEGNNFSYVVELGGSHDN